jgi:hypothetical protein
VTDDQPTCGKGLAENAALPAKFAELTDAVADILEAHLPTLDLTDEHSRAEFEVYKHLAAELRQASLRLEAIAAEMAGRRELPMGRHDEPALASWAVIEPFHSFVKLEGELLTLLQRRVEQDRQMLRAMGVSV